MIITPSPHGENPQEVHDTYPWGGRRRRGVGDICGVITTCYDIGGMPGGGYPSKGAQSGQAPQTLHAKAMKVQGGYNSGGTNTTTAVT